MLGDARAESDRQVATRFESRCHDQCTAGNYSTVGEADRTEGVAGDVESGGVADDEPDTSRVELGALGMVEGEVLRLNERHVRGPLPHEQREVCCSRSGGQYGYRLIADLIAVAVGTVQNVSPPTLPHPVDRGQAVDEPTGQQDPPGPYSATVVEAEVKYR
ncbi:hypothetical protein AFB00_12175 [Pseudonocardia sp. HH130630-07]|nr:hypothetical protein AFB00_12175 [Pseudonocardia sp. HH130630-07]